MLILRCPETEDQFFGNTQNKSDLTAEGVTYVFNLRKAAQFQNGNAVQYARLICNVTLCVDEFRDESDLNELYPELPKVSI